MLAKNPLDLGTGKTLSAEELAQAVRLAISAELDAINLYLQIAACCGDERVKEVFQDVAREEKTHVGEFLEVLLRLDPEQAKELEEGEKEIKEIFGE